jgi:hypothetical protein
MCSHEEWEKLLRRVEDAIESEDLRDRLAETAVPVEALIDEIKVRPGVSENAEMAWRMSIAPATGVGGLN